MNSKLICANGQAGENQGQENPHSHSVLSPPGSLSGTPQIVPWFPLSPGQGSSTVGWWGQISRRRQELPHFTAKMASYSVHILGPVLHTCPRYE